MSARHKSNVLLRGGLAAAALAGLLAAAGLYAWAPRRAGAPGASGEPRLAVVERRVFELRIRRPGVLQPLAKQAVHVKVGGSILHIVENGARVKKGDLLFEIDPKPTAEALVRQESKLRRLAAEREKDVQNAKKEIRKAQDNVAAKRLSWKLEELRLKDLRKGPGAGEVLTARTNRENADRLREALQEEYRILASLARDGFVARSEVRQKGLELTEQKLKVTQARIAYRKLFVPDPVTIAEQELKVREAAKNLETAQERVRTQERGFQRSSEQFRMRITREKKWRDKLKEKLGKTRHLAPHPGVALIGKRWGIRIGLGRQVWEGSEVMTLSDLRRMKALCTVDEGRIARVRKGEPALVQLANAGGETYAGRVTKVAEQGRDEFEGFRQETRNIIGEADRQVFEVEVTLEGEHPGLRPGLRVEVQLIAQRLEEALVVPRAAVFRNAGEAPFVRVAAPSGPQRQTVQVVAGDELHCAIQGTGLSEGARVWLVKP